MHPLPFLQTILGSFQSQRRAKKMFKTICRNKFYFLLSSYEILNIFGGKNYIRKFILWETAVDKNYTLSFFIEYSTDILSTKRLHKYHFRKTTVLYICRNIPIWRSEAKCRINSFCGIRASYFWYRQQSFVVRKYRDYAISLYFWALVEVHKSVLPLFDSNRQLDMGPMLLSRCFWLMKLLKRRWRRNEPSS